MAKVTIVVSDEIDEDGETSVNVNLEADPEIVTGKETNSQAVGLSMLLYAKRVLSGD